MIDTTVVYEASNMIYLFAYLLLFQYIFITVDLRIRTSLDLLCYAFMCYRFKLRFRKKASF